MKKSIFLLAGILGLSLASCEDKSDLGIAQVNEKPVIVQANGAKVTESALLKSGKIDLSNYVGEDIPVLEFELDNTFPETATITGTMQVAANNAFENPVEIPITMIEAPSEETKEEDATETSGITRKYRGVVSETLWELAFVSFYGNDPKEMVNYYRYELFLTDGTQMNVLTDGYVGENHIIVVPEDQKLDVEATYYIGGNHIGNGTLAGGVQMSHSQKHQYDDPEFSFVAEVEEGVSDYTWYIIPGSVMSGSKNMSDCYGVTNVENIESGILLLMSDGGLAGQLPNEGKWKITVNMLTRTYTVTLAAETLYVVGPASTNGFGSKALQIPTSNFIDYAGVGLVKDNFKLATKRSKNGLTFGLGAAEGELASANNFDAATFIDVPGSTGGLYYISANVVNLTYSTYEIKTIGIIGSLDNYTADIAQLTPDKNNTTWTGEFTVNAACTYKFRANGAWDVNWGGSLDNLTQDGANIELAEAGTYSVTLDFTSLPYKATVTKK